MQEFNDADLKHLAALSEMETSATTHGLPPVPGIAPPEFGKGCGKGAPFDGSGKGLPPPPGGAPLPPPGGALVPVPPPGGAPMPPPPDGGKGGSYGPGKGHLPQEVPAGMSPYGSNPNPAMVVMGKMGPPLGKGAPVPPPVDQRDLPIWEQEAPEWGAKWGKGEKEYMPGKYIEDGYMVGIEGLKDAVVRACEPHLHKEDRWSKWEMVNKVCFIIFKTAARFYKEDERQWETGTAIQGQALLEEFTCKIMSHLQGGLYEKSWFHEMYFSEAIALTCIYKFKGGPLFRRTVAPMIVTHIDEAIFRWREEERQTRVMWDAIAASGFRSDYQKKANKHLLAAYEAAHISAKWGTSQASTADLGLVQDFVEAWMTEFCRRAWDVLHNGIPNSSNKVQIGVLTVLFQYLCDPLHSCLPHDLAGCLTEPPPANWEFVQSATFRLFAGGEVGH